MQIGNVQLINMSTSWNFKQALLTLVKRVLNKLLPCYTWKFTL